MSALQTVADKVHVELESDGSRSFDINVIIDILKQIFALFGGCALSPKQAKKRAENVALGKGLGHRLDRLRLRRLIAGRAPDEQTDEIEAALLDAVDNVAETEYAACMAEVLRKP